MFCLLVFGVFLLVVAGMVVAWLLGAGMLGVGMVAFQWRYVQAVRSTGRSSLGLGQLVRLNLWEAGAALTLGWWHLRALPAPVRRVPNGAEGSLVLLVHGYTQNSTNMWGVQRALFAVGRPSERVFLGFAWPWRRVEDYAAALVAVLERQPEPVWVVAHSMGGIVLREVLTRNVGLRDRLAGVVTLGTPHRGTAVHPRVAHIIRPADQLAFDAPWLRLLPTLPELLPGRPITTVGSDADMIVYPELSTRQLGAPHVHFEDIGHGGLLTDPRSIGAVVRAVYRER